MAIVRKKNVSDEEIGKMGVDIFNGRVVISGCSVTDTKTRTIVLRNTSQTVKRCLFGPVDHEEVMSFFRRELTKFNLEKIRKWNFDFVAGQPLGGNFEWRKVMNEPAKNTRAKVTKLKTKRSPLKTVKFYSPNTLHDDDRNENVKRGNAFVDCPSKEDATWSHLTNNLLRMAGEKNKNFDQ